MTEDIAQESTRLRPSPRRLVWLVGPVLAVVVTLISNGDQNCIVGEVDVMKKSASFKVYAV